jgi:hypothetical protein
VAARQQLRSTVYFRAYRASESRVQVSQVTSVFRPFVLAVVHDGVRPVRGTELGTNVNKLTDKITRGYMMAGAYGLCLHKTIIQTSLSRCLSTCCRGTNEASECFIALHEQLQASPKWSRWWTQASTAVLQVLAHRFLGDYRDARSPARAALTRLVGTIRCAQYETRMHHGVGVLPGVVQLA